MFTPLNANKNQIKFNFEFVDSKIANISVTSAELILANGCEKRFEVRTRSSCIHGTSFWNHKKKNEKKESRESQCEKREKFDSNLTLDTV